MVSYLFKLLYLVLFSLVVIFTYYYKFSFHMESFVGYVPYIVVMTLYYSLYKGYNYILGNKNVVFTPIKIFGLFLVQLLLLNVLTFTLTGSDGGSGITLFFKILGYLFFPTIFVLSFISFGKILLEKISGFKEETSVFQFLSSLGIGFFVFLTLVTVFGFVGFYNLYTVLGVLIIMIGISYKEFFKVLKSLFNYKIEIQDHTSNDGKSSVFSKINLYLLSSEFLFIIISFLISINFINIVRPMPIGWDDLGVYMNYPNLMASAGNILDLGGMFSWQVFTGIGYMISGATQAFFLNNIGGILSLIVIVLTFSDLLKSSKKTFINIPLLAGTIFLAMPMVIFQQAKDMKLDPGLFFVSAIVLYMVLYIFLKYLGYKNEKNIGNVSITTDKNTQSETIEVTYKKENEDGPISYFTKFIHIGEDIFSNKTYLIYLLIIGVLAGFAFTIKFTSLLLISSIIGIIFYSKLGMAGFIAYLSFYIAIFTKGGLWSMMNVVYPKDDTDLINKVFIGGIIIGGVLLAYSINKYKIKAFKNFGVILSIFLAGVLIGLSPWLAKNIVSTGKLDISSILSGKYDSFKVDYTKIYSQSELDEIIKKNSLSTMTSSGVSTNEDLGRYFGYEKGINNYMKLPYNLTMQSNQRGEYTDITYIFLALLPVILFLSFKAELFSLGAFIFTLIPFSFFFISSTNNIFTNFFSKFELPFGYVIIGLFFIIPFLYFIYALNKDKHSVLFKLNLVFGVFYIFLWAISAFGIVWYGITMYYSILFAFSIGIYYISSYNESDKFKEKFFKFFGSLVTLIIVGVYFFYSTFPHGFNNLTQASYLSFKAGMNDNYTAIFESHPDYFNVLVELNIKKDRQKSIVDEIISQTKHDKIKNILLQNNITDLINLNGALSELINLKDENNQIEIALINSEANKLRSKLYKQVLYPAKENKNTTGIYRIGTFLRYFISDNHNRLLEDSLIFEFSKYFYDGKDVNIGVERMKKMGVNYFLVDLNAATIDKDPAHNLTTRYENLLKTFTSDKLELVQSDSICLKIALEDYNKSPKSTQDLDNYLRLAGVNYESYTSTGETINRGVKQLECYNTILKLIGESGKINDKNYSYLLPIVNYLNQNKMASQEELVNFFQNYIGHGWMVLFRIK